MSFEEFMESAENAVYDYVRVERKLKDKDDGESFEVFRVWSCGNDNSFNALFKSDIDTNYYEVAYSSETDQMRLEIYELSTIEKLK